MTVEKICVGCGLPACDRRCPDAEQEKPVGHCCKCGAPLCAGERVFRIDLDVFCEECADPQNIAVFFGWDGWEDFGC